MFTPFDFALFTLAVASVHRMWHYETIFALPRADLQRAQIKAGRAQYLLYPLTCAACSPVWIGLAVALLWPALPAPVIYAFAVYLPVRALVEVYRRTDTAPAAVFPAAPANACPTCGRQAKQAPSPATSSKWAQARAATTLLAGWPAHLGTQGVSEVMDLLNFAARIDERPVLLVAGPSDMTFHEHLVGAVHLQRDLSEEARERCGVDDDVALCLTEPTAAAMVWVSRAQLKGTPVVLATDRGWEGLVSNGAALWCDMDSEEGIKTAAHSLRELLDAPPAQARTDAQRRSTDGVG